MKMSGVFDLPLTRFVPERGNCCIFDAALVKVGKVGLHVTVVDSDCDKNVAMDAIVLATNNHDKLMDLARLASLILHDNPHNSVVVKTMAKELLDDIGCDVL